MMNAISNRFTDVNGTNPVFASQMAILFQPNGPYHTVVMLDQNYRITTNGLPGNGAVTAAQYRNVQQPLGYMFDSIPPSSQYRVVGASIMIENTTNMMDAAGRISTIAMRYPDRNGVLDYRHLQQGIGSMGPVPVGGIQFATAQFGLQGAVDTFNVFNSLTAKGLRDLPLNPRNWTQDVTYQSRPLTQRSCVTLPLTDIADATL